MSIITENSSLESALQPSLVYPSLPGRYNSLQQQSNKYRRHQPTPKHNDDDDDVEEEDNNNSKELQTCIHFASRLIKLRSELRSPSYMRSSTSLQMLYNNNNYDNSHYFQQHHPSSNNTHIKSPPLSEVGRVNSLPNVLQYSASQQEEHPYLNKLDKHDREDESEILDYTSTTNSSTLDEASQLTYLSELVRANRTKQKDLFFNAKNNSLALPPRQQLMPDEIKKKHRLSNIPPNNNRPRSVSLRDMIHEVVDDAIMKPNIKLVRPITSDRFSSLALASQLLYASQNNFQNIAVKKEEEDKENKEINDEKEEILLSPPSKEEEEDIVEEEGSTKIQLETSSSSKFIKYLKPQQKDDDIDEDCYCTCYKRRATSSTPPAAPKPSLSRDTNKSLFSTLSSDSESEDETNHNVSNILFNNNNRIKKRPTTTAFLVSLSPSSAAAAASVAKSRRIKKHNIRIQQQ